MLYNKFALGVHFFCPLIDLYICVSSFSAFNSPYLIVYSDISVDIYDIGIMEWVQTIPIKGVSIHEKYERVGLLRKCLNKE